MATPYLGQQSSHEKHEESRKEITGFFFRLLCPLVFFVAESAVYHRRNGNRMRGSRFRNLHVDLKLSFELRDF